MAREFLDISIKIWNDINLYCQNQYDEGHRNHLGASIIGDKCKRKLWFTFRWVYHHIHSGRMQRLFNTGHKEEARIIEWLRGAGYEVFDRDENGKQFKVSDVNGHFGGSTDGLIIIPELGKCLLECKTNKTGVEFKAFLDYGYKENKPKHWAQTCVYGKKLGLEYVVYVCKNKDNDDLFIEVAKLDNIHADEMLTKAQEIIYAKEPPSRIAETAAYFECKFCDYVDVCHKGKALEKNCRSCKFAEPVENAEWKCNKYCNVIPSDFIKTGCDAWEGII